MNTNWCVRWGLLAGVCEPRACRPSPKLVSKMKSVSAGPTRLPKALGKSDRMDSGAQRRNSNRSRHMLNRDNTRIAYIPTCPSVLTPPNRSATRHSGQHASLTHELSRRVILRRNITPSSTHCGRSANVAGSKQQAHSGTSGRRYSLASLQELGRDHSSKVLIDKVHESCHAII